MASIERVQNTFRNVILSKVFLHYCRNEISNIECYEKVCISEMNRLVEDLEFAIHDEEVLTKYPHVLEPLIKSYDTVKRDLKRIEKNVEFQKYLLSCRKTSNKGNENENPKLENSREEDEQSETEIESEHMIEEITSENTFRRKSKTGRFFETKRQKERERVKNAKRKTVSFEGEQESLCLGLLMRHGIRFVLLKPRKLNIGDVNSLNAIFMTIQKIHIGEHMIDFNDLIQNDIDKVDEYLEENEMTKSNRNYHLKKNLICSTNNFLSELLLRIGYYIDFHNNNSTKNLIIQMKRIVSISGKGINLTDKSSVSEMGIEVNKRLKTIFQLNVKKSETPYEFGYEHVHELFDPSDNQELFVELLLQEYSKQDEKENQEEAQQLVFDFEPMQEDFVEYGYEIRQCEFGWYATPLKKEMKQYPELPSMEDED